MKRITDGKNNFENLTNFSFGVQPKKSELRYVVQDKMWTQIMFQLIFIDHSKYFYVAIFKLYLGTIMEIFLTRIVYNTRTLISLVLLPFRTKLTDLAVPIKTNLVIS